jgi:hypothetical protein
VVHEGQRITRTIEVLPGLVNFYTFQIDENAETQTEG